jgi:hypothetical protein
MADYKAGEIAAYGLMDIPPHHFSPLFEMVADLKNPRDIPSIPSILSAIDPWFDYFARDSPILPLELGDINDPGAIGLEQQIEIFEIESLVDGALVLEDSSGQSAMYEEHFRDGYRPGIDEIVGIVCEKPIPGAIPKSFVQR